MGAFRRPPSCYRFQGNFWNFYFWGLNKGVQPLPEQQCGFRSPMRVTRDASAILRGALEAFRMESAYHYPYKDGRRTTVLSARSPHKPRTAASIITGSTRSAAFRWAAPSPGRRLQVGSAARSHIPPGKANDHRGFLQHAPYSIVFSSLYGALGVCRR